MVTVIEQPKFSPAYEPAVIDGVQMRDSIEIKCPETGDPNIDENFNEFMYNAWDGYARWFELVREGEVIFAGSMEVGDTFLMNVSDTWVVRYFVNEIYEYQVVNGKCATQSQELPSTTTTLTQPTTPTTREETPSTTTTEPKISSTTSQPENTSTSVPTTLVSSSPPTTEESAVLLVSGPGLTGICQWDETASQFRNAEGDFMAYSECSQPGPDELASTGADFNLGHAAGLGVILLVIGLLIREGLKRHKIDQQVRRNLNLHRYEDRK